MQILDVLAAEYFDQRQRRHHAQEPPLRIHYGHFSNAVLDGDTRHLFLIFLWRHGGGVRCHHFAERSLWGLREEIGQAR
jgi:hypothetical protein